MTDQLDFPPIDEAAQSTAVATAAPDGAVEFEKIDLKKIALAQFGDWRKDVTDVKAQLKDVIHDFSTQSKVDDGKSLRHRLINLPLAKQRKVNKALKSKLNDVSKDVGAELEAIEAGYAEADKLITPQIEAADAKLEADRQERARIERERVEAHEARLDIFRNVITRAQGLPSERIAAAIAAVEGITVSPDEWEEFAARAEAVKGETLTTLRDMHAKADEAERVEAQRVENERRERELAEREAALAEAARAQEAERRRLADIEQKRVERIDARLANLAAKRAYTADRSVAWINASILELTSQPPSEDLFAEKLEQGTADHAAALAHLQEILPAAIEREQAAEMARIAAESAAAAATAPQASVDLTNPASLSQMASEILAHNEAKEVIPVAAPVSQVRQPDPAPAPAEEDYTFSISDINALIAPIKIDAAGMAHFGFNGQKRGPSTLFKRSDVLKFGSLGSNHLLTVMAAKSLEKAA